MTVTKDELRRLLTAERIPEHYYSLEGGLESEQLCLAQTKKGWQVYYSQRGGRYRLESFALESDACDRFYQRLKQMLE